MSEIHELFEECQITISCLFRISAGIPLASSTTRYGLSKDLALQSGGGQDEQLPDIAFVRQQFPKVRAMPWLEKQLGLSVTLRREFVRCRKELYIADGRERKDIKLVDIPVARQLLVPRVKGELDDDKRLAATYSYSSHRSVRKVRRCPIYDDSKGPDLPWLAKSEESNDSESRDAPHETREGISKPAELSLCPPFPKEGNKGARFFCPYCWTRVSIRENAEENEKIWKQHVYEDLQPYISTIEKDSSLKMFSDFRSWSDHEIIERTELRCDFCPRVPFKNRQDLALHLFTQHLEDCKEEGLLERMLDAADQATSKIKLSACPFCDPSEKDVDAAVDLEVFAAHVARHMEKLAFYSLYQVSFEGVGQVSLQEKGKMLR
ncbi:MAG: hypothetical protein Q9195_005061 [Heterodermia aff. obscurata]